MVPPPERDNEHATVPADGHQRNKNFNVWDEKMLPKGTLTAAYSDATGPGEAHDMKGPSQALVTIKDSLPKGGRALVPGPRLYDAIALTAQSREVVALATTSEAVKAVKAARSAMTMPSRLTLESEPFFEHVSQYDVVWDAGFVATVPPALRAKWAEKVNALVHPAGSLAVCVWPIIQGALAKDQAALGDDMPPYAVEFDAINALLKVHGFVVQQHEVLAVGGLVPYDVKHGVQVAVWNRPGAMGDKTQTGWDS